MILFFLKIILEDIRFFLWGHWYPCFGLLVMVSSGFQSQSRVGSLIHTLRRCMCYTFPEIHLLCDIYWPLSSQHGSWTDLLGIGGAQNRDLSGNRQTLNGFGSDFLTIIHKLHKKCTSRSTKTLNAFESESTLNWWWCRSKFKLQTAKSKSTLNWWWCRSKFKLQTAKSKSDDFADNHFRSIFQKFKIYWRTFYLRNSQWIQ